MGKIYNKFKIRAVNSPITSILGILLFFYALYLFEKKQIDFNNLMIFLPFIFGLIGAKEK